MKMTHSGDKTDHLTILNASKEPPQTSTPGVHLLETFPNQYPHRAYVISVMFPEYTSLCPVTGQPDFGTIVLEYIPDLLCVESKSFKLYMFAYRTHQTFMETLTNTILEDIVHALDPFWCRVKGLFSPRGATYMHIFAEHYKNIQDVNQLEHIKAVTTSWKQEPSSHTWK